MNTGKLLLVVLLCLSSGLVFAQDEITFINGDRITGKVIEIKLELILYQHPDSLENHLSRA